MWVFFYKNPCFTSHTNLFVKFIKFWQVFPQGGINRVLLYGLIKWVRAEGSQVDATENSGFTVSLKGNPPNVTSPLKTTKFTVFKALALN